MIFDFGCREALGFFDYILSLAPGAIAILFVVAGLALIGMLFAQGNALRASDVFVG
ncbi:MAG: hypothetical protein WC464_02785 [Bdellovibrionales bacterium]